MAAGSAAAEIQRIAKTRRLRPSAAPENAEPPRHRCGGSRHSGRREGRSDLFLDLQDLPTAIHAGLQVDVVRAVQLAGIRALDIGVGLDPVRSEEHTSELQSLMRISYAVFCLKKK